MKPLNDCLAHYMEENKSGRSNAPSWILFHDNDEYIYPEDTSFTMLDALEQHKDTCCALVSRYTTRAPKAKHIMLKSRGVLELDIFLEVGSAIGTL